MAERKTKACDANTQKHLISPFKIKACTKEDAKRAITVKLLDRAEEDRKVKCKDLKCFGADIGGSDSGKCVTTLDPEDLELFLGAIRFLPVRSKKCPQKLGWIAQVFDDNPGFTSFCTCDPGADKEFF